MHDEIHIKRDLPATIIVKKLEELIASINIPTNANKTTTTQEYAIPEGKVGLIIGQKGTNLRKWTKENSVHIEVTREDHPVARVTGAEPHVSATINAMKDMVEWALPREREAPTNWRHGPSTTTKTQRPRYASRSPVTQNRQNWDMPQARRGEEWRKPREEQQPQARRGEEWRKPREEQQPRSRTPWQDRH